MKDNERDVSSNKHPGKMLPMAVEMTGSNTLQSSYTQTLIKTVHGVVHHCKQYLEYNMIFSIFSADSPIHILLFYAQF